MRQSHLFTKTSKTPPKDEPSLNARLLTQAGFISKDFAGVYNLPLATKLVTIKLLWPLLVQELP